MGDSGEETYRRPNMNGVAKALSLSVRDMEPIMAFDLEGRGLVP